MSRVFQNIDSPPPLSPRRVCAFVAGGGHTRRAERGVGGQHFGRRETEDWPLAVLISLRIYLCVYVSGSGADMKPDEGITSTDPPCTLLSLQAS
jgi:hypothetical protein